MLPEKLVCPDCGSDHFIQRRYAVLEVEGNIYDGLGFEDLSETVIDGGDRDEDWECSDCSMAYGCEDELITEQAYNDAETC